jgi:hypothetical protein
MADGGLALRRLISIAQEEAYQPDDQGDHQRGNRKGDVGCDARDTASRGNFGRGGGVPVNPD